MAATIGQMLEPGTGAAAADSVSAAGSIADTSASAGVHVDPGEERQGEGRADEADGAERPFLGDAVGDRRDDRQDGAPDEQSRSGEEHRQQLPVWLVGLPGALIW